MTRNAKPRKKPPHSRRMNRVEDITPYGTEGDSRAKGSQVRDMFDKIAPAYDRMNRMMTFGLDNGWRRRSISRIAGENPATVLDLACGTADMTIMLAEAIPRATITGADLSEGMLEVGRRKVEKKGLSDRIDLRRADALHLPFADETFDAITIAFGVRNFEDLPAGYTEMSRVLRKGGTITVLELTPPAKSWIKPFYRFYTRCIIPAAGRMMSDDNRAYAYLPESIAAVPSRFDMTAIMEQNGFEEASFKDLTFGVAAIYTARKRVRNSPKPTPDSQNR